MKTIVLISCSKTKLPYPAKAKEIYQGSNFKKSLKIAELSNADKVFILSAKHGLLELDTYIEPYNETLIGKPEEYKRVWAEKVLKELIKKTNINLDKFILLAPKDYIKNLKTKIKNYEALLNGYNMFQLPKRLNQLIDYYKNE